MHRQRKGKDGLDIRALARLDSQPSLRLDQEVADAVVDANAASAQAGPAGILIVGCPDSARTNLLTPLENRRHRLCSVASLNEALAAIARESFDLVIVHDDLPDGQGLQLAEFLQRGCPATKTIVLASTDSFATAVDAMRLGVIDLIRLPVDGAEFAARIDAALLRSRADRQREERLSRLKQICAKLNTARHEIGARVDDLCEDLVAAYEDMAEQLNEVAMASEFRTLVRLELDVEDLLRTALEYLLTKTGPTNAAVFLPDDNDQFSLGAYVNYDCPRETISVLLDHLGRAICPQMAEETDIVAFGDAAEFAEFVGAEASFLGECEVIAFSCLHEEKCMAVIVLFRDRTEPFSEELASVIEVLRPIFAEQVAGVIRIHHRASPQWPSEAVDDECDLNDEPDYGFGGLAA